MKTNKIVTGYTKIKGKSYQYSITPDDKDDELVFFECGDLFQQYYSKSDIYELLEDLPDLIIDELLERKKIQNRRIQFRVSELEHKTIEKNAAKKGFKSTSEYLRSIAMETT